MTTIIPTIFAQSKKEFKERFKKLQPVSQKLQIDFMDGKFVPGTSVQLQDIPQLTKYKNSFEAHLMVKNPEAWIIPLEKKGFKKVIFHYEAVRNKGKILNIISELKEKKMEPVLALNPGTGTGIVKPFLAHIKTILVMGIVPGKEGQTFLPTNYQKIKELKKMKLNIQIDGGINEKTIGKIAAAGATIFNSGSFVATSENPQKAIKTLQQVARP